MARSWRNSAVTTTALFLEAVALYLVIVVVCALIKTPQAKLPFWLVGLALGSGFLISSYILNLNVIPRVRGLIGLAVGVPVLLGLAALNTGAGFVPVEALSRGSPQAVLGFAGTTVFLIIVWWRAVSVSREDVTLDSVRSAFLGGVIVLFIAALVDSAYSERLVNGFLVIGFFAVGLAGMALARFTSEIGEDREMSSEWFLPITVCVGGVLALGLIISAVGLGGLDDVTRELLHSLGTVGFWILKPVLYVIGLLAGALVSVGNWLSGIMGGGDLEGLLEAQRRLDEFHEGLREEVGEGERGSILFSVLKWTALGLGILAASWTVYQLFRARRRWGRSSAVEESRESLFSWRRAGDDLSDYLSSWWSGLFPPSEGRGQRPKEPLTPREFYHGLLRLAGRAGRPKSEWETPKEHQRALSGLLPADPVAHIVDAFQSAHYGNEEPEQPAADELGEDWQTLNQFLDEQERGQQ